MPSSDLPPTVKADITMGAAENLIENRTYDELAPGQRAEFSRTVTMDDIHAFALVSGDVNPAHVDAEYAEGTRFHGVIAHGMFAGALISSLLGTEFPGPGTIYLEQSLRFRRPVRVGDRLTVAVTVLHKDDATHNVRLDCTVLNQALETVVSGEALVKAPQTKVARPRASMPTLHLFDPAARLEAWMAGLRAQPAVRCAVVHPCDAVSLRGALDAAQHGLIEPVLVGPLHRLHALADDLALSLDGCTLVDTPHSHASAAAAVAMAARGEAPMLMKGSLHTDELMQAVLAEPALRTGRRMSHVFRFEVPAYPKPLLVTDAAINIRPTLEDKADIVRNAIDVAKALGVARPKVAILAAVESADFLYLQRETGLTKGNLSALARFRKKLTVRINQFDIPSTGSYFRLVLHVRDLLDDTLGHHYVVRAERRDQTAFGTRNRLIKRTRQAFVLLNAQVEPMLLL